MGTEGRGRWSRTAVVVEQEPDGSWVAGYPGRGYRAWFDGLEDVVGVGADEAGRPPTGGRRGLSGPCREDPTRNEEDRTARERRGQKVMRTEPARQRQAVRTS